MAKSEKKVSISTIDGIIKNGFQSVVTDTWHDVEVVIKSDISLVETLEFVNDVVTICFSEENGYLPEVMDFAIRSNVIARYTNLSLPDNLEHRHQILYQTDVIDFVCQHIDMVQLHEITTSIERKLTYLCNTNVANIQKQMGELISALEDMEQKTTDMFSQFTPDDMVKIMSAFENGEFNEDKIVSAYLKQTAPAEISE